MRARGSTILEVMIALLITALVVTAVFPVMLSSRTNLNRASRRRQGTVYAQNMMDQLKSYVGSVSLTSDFALLPNSGHFRGPGASPAWQDACTGCSNPNPPGPSCYALEVSPAVGPPCTHVLDSMLPAEFRNAPYNGELRYAVSPITEGSHTLYKVDVQVQWDEPQGG